MPLFIRILLIAGLPLGLAATVATARGSPVSWFDLGLTFITTGLMLGGTLASVTHLFVRRVRRTGWTVLLLFLSLSVTGLVAGVAVYALARWVPHGRWARIASPPEPIHQFEGPTCYELGRDATVYGRSISGRLYQYVKNATSDWTWVPADEPQSPPPGGLCTRAPSSKGRTPFKLGPIVAARQIDLRGVDCGGRTHFLLLKDGSLWQWSTGSCAIGDFIMLLILAALLILMSLFVTTAAALLKPPLGWARTPRNSQPVAA
jgi:hypothetical protein